MAICKPERCGAKKIVVLYQREMGGGSASR